MSYDAKVKGTYGPEKKNLMNKIRLMGHESKAFIHVFPKNLRVTKQNPSFPKNLYETRQIL